MIPAFTKDMYRGLFCYNYKHKYGRVIKIFKHQEAIDFMECCNIQKGTYLYTIYCDMRLKRMKDKIN